MVARQIVLVDLRRVEGRSNAVGGPGREQHRIDASPIEGRRGDGHVRLQQRSERGRRSVRDGVDAAQPGADPHHLGLGRREGGDLRLAELGLVDVGQGTEPVRCAVARLLTDVDGQSRVLEALDDRG